MKQNYPMKVVGEIARRLTEIGVGHDDHSAETASKLFNGFMLIKNDDTGLLTVLPPDNHLKGLLR